MPIALIPASATSSQCSRRVIGQVRSAGRPAAIPVPECGSRSCCGSVFVRASTTVMESLWPLETNTAPPSTATPEGLLPPKLLASPNGRPVRTSASRRGFTGFDTSTTASEFDSGTFGSPSPGTSTAPFAVSRRAPLRASSDGNPKAGNGSPVSTACFCDRAGQRAILEHADVRDVGFPPVGRKRDRKRQAAQAQRPQDPPLAWYRSPPAGSWPGRARRAVRGRGRAPGRRYSCRRIRPG